MHVAGDQKYLALVLQLIDWHRSVLQCHEFEQE